MALLPVAANAQAESNALKFTWKLDGAKVTTVKSLAPQVQYQPAFKVQQIKYTLPKTAIFCRMEDAVYKKYNLIFKIRMGCDDTYSN